MGPFDVANKREQVERLEEEGTKPGFWDDVETAQASIQRLKQLKLVTDQYEELQDGLEEARVLLEMVEEEESFEFLEELGKNLDSLECTLEEFKLEALLSGEYDENNAIVSVHAGVGGLEAQDWAEMLFRMYTRWVSDREFTYRVTDYNSDTEGGIKSVTFVVNGYNAYGYLKGEKGVHRLVRISPFDTSNRRHTSFASVDVFPELKATDNVEINQSDLKIDTYRATGAGGQHVNTTDSAVRITHIPTGVVVQCQSERSQISNRETAMRMLYAKLLQIAEEEQKEKIDDIQGKYTQIGWGSQIRSYVFHPYQMVKDHRTQEETGNIQAVMDGEIESFINACLKHGAAKRNQRD